MELISQVSAHAGKNKCPWALTRDTTVVQCMAQYNIQVIVTVDLLEPGK